MVEQYQQKCFSLLRTIQGTIGGTLIGFLGFLVAVRVFGFNPPLDDERGGLALAFFGGVVAAASFGAVIGGFSGVKECVKPVPTTGGVRDRKLDS